MRADPGGLAHPLLTQVGDRPTVPEPPRTDVWGLDSRLIFRLEHKRNVFRLGAVNRQDRDSHFWRRIISRKLKRPPIRDSGFRSSARLFQDHQEDHMAKRIRNFVDRAFSRTVDLELLHRLLIPYLDKIDFDLDALPEDDGERREVIFDLFAKADKRFPAKLQFALYNISTLSTDAGARIIQEIASEAEVDVLSAYRVESVSDDLRFTPRFIALVTWLDNRIIFDRALSAAAFLAHSTKLERDADREDVELRHHEAGVQEGFAEAARLHFASRYNGHYCDVRWFEEEDLLRVLILHGSKAETKNVDQEGTEDTLKFREIVQSTIEYDPRRGSIAVGSKSATDAKKLVNLFGEHILGDGDIFDASAKEKLYTLAPLQKHGTAFRFAFHPKGEITHVALREVRIDEAQLTATGRLRRSPWFLTLGDSDNALRRLNEVAPEIDVTDVRIVHAKIDVTIEVDDSEIVVPVMIRPPRTVSMRDHSHERLILEMLEDNEIRMRRRADQTAVAAE
ncbi:MAG: hypothetical protein HC909_02515 [Blastochloris sp.]|nr:hypothetical protein [Blastochloris sp.]